MAAPTFVAEYESAWNTGTTPKTASVTVNTGDVLVIAGISETNNAFSTPTGGGLTYTLAQNILVASYTSVYVWTAVAASSQTFTLSVACAGGQHFGFNCLRFSGSDGPGASSKTNIASGAPSLAVTTGGANSAVVAFNGDWNAGGGARTWRTINSITPTSGNGLEVSYNATGNMTIYGAYWSDAGAAGAKTTGLTAPTGQKYSIVAVEVLGSAGGTDDTATPAATATIVTVPAASVSAGSAATLAAAALTTTLPAATLSAGASVTPTAIAAAVSLPAASAGAAAVRTPGPLAATVALPGPTLSAGSTPTPAALAAAVALPVASLGAGSTPTPAALAAVVTIPAPTVTAGGSATATPASVALVAAMPAVTLSAGARTTPAAVALVTSPPAASATGGTGATTAPAAVSVTASLPATSPRAGATPTPATVALAVAIPRSTIPTQEDARGTGGYITASTPAGRITASTSPRYTTSTGGGRL